jgi:hypothetical protein
MPQRIKIIRITQIALCLSLDEPMRCRGFMAIRINRDDMANVMIVRSDFHKTSFAKTSQIERTALKVSKAVERIRKFIVSAVIFGELLLIIGEVDQLSAYLP